MDIFKHIIYVFFPNLHAENKIDPKEISRLILEELSGIISNPIGLNGFL